MGELPKQRDVDRAELTREDVHHPEQAAKRFMIDHSHSSRKGSDPAAEDDAGLEEARLRQQAIGVKLRHMFDQVVNEPVPDEFLDILRKADRKAEGGS
jgi:hypothetical protein